MAAVALHGWRSTVYALRVARHAGTDGSGDEESFLTIRKLSNHKIHHRVNHITLVYVYCMVLHVINVS